MAVAAVRVYSIDTAASVLTGFRGTVIGVGGAGQSFISGRTQTREFTRCRVTACRAINTGIWVTHVYYILTERPFISSWAVASETVGLIHTRSSILARF